MLCFFRDKCFIFFRSSVKRLTIKLAPNSGTYSDSPRRVSPVTTPTGRLSPSGALRHNSGPEPDYSREEGQGKEDSQLNSFLPSESPAHSAAALSTSQRGSFMAPTQRQSTKSPRESTHEASQEGKGTESVSAAAQQDNGVPTPNFAQEPTSRETMKESYTPDERSPSVVSKPDSSPRLK